MEKNYLFALGGFVLAILLISVFSGITGHSIFNWIFSSEDSSQGNSLSSSEMHSNQDSASSDGVDHCSCLKSFRELIWKKVPKFGGTYPIVSINSGGICTYWRSSSSPPIICQYTKKGVLQCRGDNWDLADGAEKCKDAYRRLNNTRACLRGEKFQDNKICKEMKRKWDALLKKAEEECIPCESEKRCGGNCWQTGEDCHLTDGDGRPLGKDKTRGVILSENYGPGTEYWAELRCNGQCSKRYAQEPTPEEEASPEPVF